MQYNPLRKSDLPTVFSTGIMAYVAIQNKNWRILLMNPLNSILGTLISGFILAIVLIFVIKLIASI
jgi:hypothetical protein